jgi:peptidoglycan/xylan/chitin deacetylase (PgdA/CDA1 family)
MNLNWPRNAKCAINLTFDNLGSAFDLFKSNNNQGIFSEGNYSVKRGLKRVLDILAKHEVKATFFIEGWNGEHNRDLVRRIDDAGHEVAAHGWLHESEWGIGSPWNKLESKKEEELIDKTTISLESAIESRLVGWRSPGALMTSRTISLLQKRGYIYSSDFVDDDVPYIMEVEKKKIDFVQLPFDWTLNDSAFYSNRRPVRSPREVLNIWKEEFDARFKETGYFNLTCHPRFSGKPTRIKVLDKLLFHMKEYSDVWFARCRDVAYWILRQSEESSNM